VYEVQEWAEVHRLFHREDLSKTEIGRRLGMSRNTVARLLGLSEPPRYERRRQGSMLDPYKGTILGWLRLDSEVAATVILERLREHGYGGGITILKDWLAEVRPHFREPRQRTSYLPGEIGQLDWWEPGIRVPVGKGASREAFGLVCSHRQRPGDAIDRGCPLVSTADMADSRPDRHRAPETNGVVERWFESLKSERLYRHDIDSGDQLAVQVEDFIDEFNRIRPHEAIDWQRPPTDTYRPPEPSNRPTLILSKKADSGQWPGWS